MLGAAASEKGAMWQGIHAREVDVMHAPPGILAVQATSCIVQASQSDPKSASGCGGWACPAPPLTNLQGTLLARQLHSTVDGFSGRGSSFLVGEANESCIGGKHGEASMHRGARCKTHTLAGRALEHGRL